MSTDVPNKVINDTVQSISVTTQKLIMQNHTHNPMDHLFLSLVASNGALSILAALLGKRPEDNNLVNAVTDESLMFAGLVYAATAKRVDKEGTQGPNVGHVDLAFGPEQLLQAMEWYEKLTGAKPDKFLDQHMVAELHRYAEEANSPLKDFLQKRPDATDGKKLH